MAMCSEARHDSHVDISFCDHLRNDPEDFEGRAGHADRDRKHDSSQAQDPISTSTSWALGRRMLMECGNIATCAMSE